MLLREAPIGVTFSRLEKVKVIFLCSDQNSSSPPLFYDGLPNGFLSEENQSTAELISAPSRGGDLPAQQIPSAKSCEKIEICRLKCSS
jgi:hypothetical protein